MKKRFKYLVLIFSNLLWVSSIGAVENAEGNTALQNQIIHSFRNTLGYGVLEERYSTAIYSDSLLSALEISKQYDAYFEISRIFIKSQVLKGEIRTAIAHSDAMYTKAKAQNNSLGLILSLSAMGQVYGVIGRNKEAGDAYEHAWKLAEKQQIDEVTKKILLIELVEYYIRVENTDGITKYLRLLNRHSTGKISEVEQDILLVFNTYYKIYTRELAVAGQYLTKVGEHQQDLLPILQQYFIVAEAFYLKRMGKTEEALKAYDCFFNLEHACGNYVFYVNTMKGKADLLEKVGRKEEAISLHHTIYSYTDSVFRANYPKEIDQLCARFQADQLAYHIERARTQSLCYYVAAVVGCIVILVLFILLSWKKIYHLKQSKKKLEEMQQKAEKGIRNKNLFLSNMSHEVRTPLNAIVGFSTLIASEEMEVEEDSRREYCQIIKVNSYQLLKLINDIIDFSDFDEDNMHMNIKQYDAVKICHEVIDTIVASYDLQVDLCFDTPLQSLPIDTDDSRLRQVLINLIVNATKFTSEGSIVLRLDHCDEEPDKALFTVTDTGCGVPVEKQKLIFERFEKLNDFVQGTGLGLSICLLIMKRLKGHIWIDESYTQGARFCFVHPLKSEENLHTTDL